MKIQSIFSPEKFLLLAGGFSVIIGILGVLSLGPTHEHSMFGTFLWMDVKENIFHTLLGLIGIAIVLIPSLKAMLLPYYKHIVLVAASIALFFSLYGFLEAYKIISPPIDFNLQHPADNILHLLLGLWALTAIVLGEKNS